MKTEIEPFNHLNNKTMKYEDLKCEFCNGAGEREINVDGMDAPQTCTFCEGTGIDQDQLKILNSELFEENDQLKAQLAKSNELWQEAERESETVEALNKELLEGMKTIKNYLDNYSNTYHRIEMRKIVESLITKAESK